MNIEQQYKINKIVKYMASLGFEFETEEVIGSLYDILSQLGLGDIKLSDDEYYFLIDDLLPLAEQYEFREVEYLTFHTTTDELQCI